MQARMVLQADGTWSAMGRSSTNGRRPGTKSPSPPQPWTSLRELGRITSLQRQFCEEQTRCRANEDRLKECKQAHDAAHAKLGATPFPAGFGDQREKQEHDSGFWCSLFLFFCWRQFRGANAGKKSRSQDGSATVTWSDSCEVSLVETHEELQWRAEQIAVAMASIAMMLPLEANGEQTILQDALIDDSRIRSCNIWNVGAYDEGLLELWRRHEVPRCGCQWAPTRRHVWHVAFFCSDLMEAFMVVWCWCQVARSNCEVSSKLCVGMAFLHWGNFWYATH